jgi:uncharacterized protein (DUF2384 family)
MMDVSPATWARIRARHFRGRLSKDKKTRVQLILQIDERVVRDGPGAHWLVIPNENFGGKKPIEILSSADVVSLSSIMARLPAPR